MTTNRRNTRIILASGSPRRRALLEALGLSFEVVVSDVHEPGGMLPRLTETEAAAGVISNARMKLDAVVARLDTPALVIAADTLVFLTDHILGKPADLAEARAMLAALSGRTHEVITGLAVCDTASGAVAEGAEITEVTFRQLSSAEIECFVEVVNPVDRAGAYTVDGPGTLLVERYNGCYQNVLGLPLIRLDLLLHELGCSLFDLMDPARCRFL